MPKERGKAWLLMAILAAWNLGTGTASKRYIRAWKKLQEFLTSLPDGREGR